MVKLHHIPREWKPQKSEWWSPLGWGIMEEEYIRGFQGHSDWKTSQIVSISCLKPLSVFPIDCNKILYWSGRPDLCPVLPTSSHVSPASFTLPFKVTVFCPKFFPFAPWPGFWFSRSWFTCRLAEPSSSQLSCLLSFSAHPVASISILLFDFAAIISMHMFVCLVYVLLLKQTFY